MKKSLFLAAGVSVLLVTGAASAAKTQYSGEMLPDNEVTPPNVVGNEGVKGYIEATYDDVAKTLCGHFIYGGAGEELTGPPTGMHLHQSPPGEPDKDGTVKLEFVPVLASETAFKVILNDAFVKSLEAGELYANIHTTKNTKGEIRSTLFEDNQLPEFDCPAANTPLGGGTPPPDAGPATPPPPNGSTTSASSSGSTSSSGADDNPPIEEGKKPPAKDEGCNTSSGAPSNVLSFALLAGLALAWASRARNGKRRS